MALVWLEYHGEKIHLMIEANKKLFDLGASPYSDAGSMQRLEYDLEYAFSREFEEAQEDMVPKSDHEALEEISKEHEEDAEEATNKLDALEQVVDDGMKELRSLVEEMNELEGIVPRLIFERLVGIHRRLVSALGNEAVVEG